MKRFEWLTLVAALLITVCEVLVFNSQTAREPQQQADVAAGSGSGTQSPAG